MVSTGLTCVILEDKIEAAAGSDYKIGENLVFEDEKAKPTTNTTSGETSGVDAQSDLKESENTEKGTGGLAETSTEEIYFSSIPG